MDYIFDDYESHLISEEARSTIVPSDCSYVDGFLRWFLRVPHLYMKQANPRDPLRPAHQETLEKEHTQLDHVDDVLPRYLRIIEIMQTNIDRGIFSDGSDVR